MPERKKDKNVMGKQKMVHFHEADINDRLIRNLRDAGHVIRFLFEGKGSQKRILIILNETGGMSQRALTRRLGVQPGSASEVLAKLENAGLIIRRPSTADRRTVDIELTEEGRLQAEDAAERRQRRHEEMFSCLSEEEKQTLLRLLEQVNSSWKSLYPEKGGK